jgi:tetratricopeptide (TPR) repeat protein
MTDDILQLAIQEHQAGNYKKAKEYYQSILHSEPSHPHANHNLGLLTRFLHNPEEALVFFKKALEINQNEGQFWISYIETLIEANEVNKAHIAVNEAKKLKINEQTLNRLGEKINEFKKLGIKKNPLTEINKLIALYNNNLLKEAENKAIRITQQYPEYPVPWKVLGVLQSKKEKWQNALKSFLKVLEITPKDEETISNLSAVQYELGMLNEARKSSIDALTLNPNYAQAYYNLGRVLYLLGNLTEAEANYRKAIDLNQNYADAYCNLGLTLEGAGNAKEAAVATRIALTINPDLHQAQENLGVWLLSLKQYEEAEIELKKAITKKSDLKENLLFCLLMQNKDKEFYKLLESMGPSLKISSLLGSVCSRAQLRYGKHTHNFYCSEPMNFVIEADLRKVCDFKKEFINPLKEISDNLTELRLQGLLTNGKQSSGNLFMMEKDKTKEIQNLIHEEVKKYKDRFKKSKEGLIQKWPKKYKLYGWLVAMKSGGKLSAHMHESGWISGSIYINVPKKNKQNDGNIGFCIEEEQFLTDGKKSPEKIIDVSTGSLCLFPSSLLHYTIPFDSEEERIVLAFDVQPDV